MPAPRHRNGPRAARPGLLLGLIAVALSSNPAAAGGQQVYSPTDLTEMPRLASPKDAGQLVLRSYPSALRDAGIEGKVHLTFIIDPDGKVEPESVEVMSAPVAALGEAASRVAPDLRFEPGKIDGRAVRTRVIFPIAYTRGE